MEKRIKNASEFLGELSVELLKTSTILFGVALVGNVVLDVREKIKRKRNK